MGSMNKIRRFELFMKHAKKFVSKDVSRPTFECACFRGGNGYATNTHTMLCVNDIWEKKKTDTLYNMHTQQIAEQGTFAFPGIAKIETVIPKAEGASVVITVSQFDEKTAHFLTPLAMWLKSGIAILKKIDRLNTPCLRISFFGNYLLFAFETKEISTECTFEYRPQGAIFFYKDGVVADFVVHFNGAMLLNALEALLDFECKEVNMVFEGPLKPFALYGGSDVVACVTPMRV